MARSYIITIASEKGGVGKTTLATNLAIYLKALADDLPVTIFSFDNHFTVDQMFRFNKAAADHHVGELFSGINPKKLLRDGQYGVSYIPSCRTLFEMQNRVRDVDCLASTISRADLHGIIVIDTSPTLDIYTRNALYAADRVIVPIKDAPSLENCRNLAAFLEQQQRSRSVLKLLPCLIDTRIHFNGPFRNSYQLLKAYAINRGYRCFDGYIAKSPKVESLSTNPEGKIYPVISHGRNTDVHLQLTHLARQVYLDYLKHGPIRLNEVANDLYRQRESALKGYHARLAKLQRDCLLCGSSPSETGGWPQAWFIEDETETLSGFIEEGCLQSLLLELFYPELQGHNRHEILTEILFDSAGRALLLLKKSRRAGGMAEISLERLDPRGEKISGRKIALDTTRSNQKGNRSRLLRLFEPAGHSTAEHQQLLLCPAGDHPLEILQHHNYMAWKTIFSRVQVDSHNHA